jgi:hypothetical protein
MDAYYFTSKNDIDRIKAAVAFVEQFKTSERAKSGYKPQSPNSYWYYGKVTEKIDYQKVGKVKIHTFTKTDGGEEPDSWSSSEGEIELPAIATQLQSGQEYAVDVMVSVIYAGWGLWDVFLAPCPTDIPEE